MAKLLGKACSIFRREPTTTPIYWVSGRFTKWFGVIDVREQRIPLRFYFLKKARTSAEILEKWPKSCTTLGVLSYNLKYNRDFVNNCWGDSHNVYVKDKDGVVRSVVFTLGDKGWCIRARRVSRLSENWCVLRP